MQKNSMRILFNNSFQYLTNLGTLDLSKCDIEVIESNSFYGLNNNLNTFLDLSFNKLKNLKDFTFQHLSKLIELSLANSNIESIEPKTFFGLNH